MMNLLSTIFLRGFRFVQNNPQIIYTLFLVVMIPGAFFFTSEQFLRVARENQDQLERNRVGMLQDVFVLFAREHIDDADYLHERILSITNENETIAKFQILKKNAANEFTVMTSKDPSDLGGSFVPDPASRVLFISATGDTVHSYAAKFFIDGVRYWRSVRAITITGTMQPVAYVVTDVSMAEADAVALKNIRSAYLVLVLIAILVIAKPILPSRAWGLLIFAISYYKRNTNAVVRWCEESSFNLDSYGFRERKFFKYVDGLKESRVDLLSKYGDFARGLNFELLHN